MCAKAATLFQGTKGAWDPVGSSIKPAYLGIGFIWAWIYCAFFTDTLGLFSGNCLELSAPQVVAAASMTAALFAIAVAFRNSDLVKSNVLVFGSAVLMGAGTCAAFALGGRDLGSGVAGAASGVGCAVQCVLWGEVMARVDDDAAEFCIPAASAIPAVAAFLVPEINGIVGVVVTAGLPLLSAACLFAARSVRDEGSDGGDANLTRLRPLLFVSFILVVSYLVLSHIDIVANPVRAVEAMPFDVPSFLGAGAGVVLAFCFVLFSPEIGFGMLYRWLLPVLMLALGLLPWLNEASALAASAISSAADMCIQALALLFLLRLAKRQHLSVILTIGLGQGFIQLGTILGYALEFAPSFRAAPLTLQSIALMVLLAIAAALIPRRASEITASANDAGIASAALLGDREADDHEQALAQLASAFGLSPREAEIAGLLARGRSQPYIREALYLSKGTVATHVKHIYRKTGVHSKQELIDLMEREREGLR